MSRGIGPWPGVICDLAELRLDQIRRFRFVRLFESSGSQRKLLALLFIPVIVE
jgi:hypothetical protein